MNAPMNAQLGTTSVDYRSRPMGVILVDEGRLRVEDAERILNVQREEGLRFGEVAKRMRLLTEEDIQYALARQFDYPYLEPGQSTLSGELIAAYTPFAPAVENLRAVRSQLMLRWFGTHGKHQSLAIVGAEAGDGRSWVSGNLAIVFSQLGQRTLLIDGNLREPRQHLLFGIPNNVGLSSLLAGRSAPNAIQRIPDLRDLSVLPAGPGAPNPQELLTRPFFGMLLSDLCGKYDVILIDTPAAADYADAQTIAARAGGALVIARDTRSRVSRILRMMDDMQDAGAQMVGSLISKH